MIRLLPRLLFLVVPLALASCGNVATPASDVVEQPSTEADVESTSDHTPHENLTTSKEEPTTEPIIKIADLPKDITFYSSDKYNAE